VSAPGTAPDLHEPGFVRLRRWDGVPGPARRPGPHRDRGAGGQRPARADLYRARGPVCPGCQPTVTSVVLVLGPGRGAAWCWCWCWGQLGAGASSVLGPEQCSSVLHGVACGGCTVSPGVLVVPCFVAVPHLLCLVSGMFGMMVDGPWWVL